ncbi:pyrroline-5-carboxylate reductase isoform X1 [Humulus lupulus]|uniref:pyrroline-5-carboxylate reductase isoform X1 n=1 Tax=Humulus lupulus TaxID=3486 RepID=UPI002B4126E2|nr:pyrroline-5-carboxylate reductase isoform X1 [Humulus lupulus]
MEVFLIQADTYKIGFIGAGKMAESIARGVVRSGVLPASRMSTSHSKTDRRQVFESFGVRVLPKNDDVVEESDVVIFSVKPQVVKDVVLQLKPLLSKKKLLVSVAAGVKLKDLQRAMADEIFPRIMGGSRAKEAWDTSQDEFQGTVKVKEWAGHSRFIRVMPNTPAAVGEAASVMSLGGAATEEDGNIIVNLFGSIGKIWKADEKLFDAATGLSGSGPAYVFLAIEALADGGVAAGLPRDLALGLASQTVLGAASMATKSGKHPGQLKDDVASPGGTTITGVHELEKGGLRGLFMNAVVAAAKRSRELS